MKPILALVTLVSCICIASCGNRNACVNRGHISTIEQLVDASPVHLHTPEGWSEDILTVYNCLKTKGKPRDIIQKGDTLTLVYGKDSTMELVYVRDTLSYEIFD